VNNNDIIETAKNLILLNHHAEYVFFSIFLEFITIILFVVLEFFISY